MDLQLATHDGRYALSADGIHVGSYADPCDAFVAASVEIDRATVTRSSRSYVLLHGACIAREDRAALIVGPSGAGKSTLTAALMLAGFEYVADEVVAVRVGSATTAAYPKPLKLDGRSRRLLARSFRRGVPIPTTNREVLVAPHEFGAASPTGRVVNPELVVMPVVAESATPTVETLSRADVGELLADQCFNFPEWGPGALSTVATIARECAGVRVPVRDLPEATRAIDGLLQ
jgi:hypothetical protein